MRKLTFSSSFGRTGGLKSSIQSSRLPPRDASDFLRRNDKLGALLPTLTRMAAVQKQCIAGLPSMFNTCEVVLFEAGQLVLSAPNAALATKLKQQLPKLQEYLLLGNWQVNAIRIKVQVGTSAHYLTARPTPPKQAHFTPQALSAFAMLAASLEPTSSNKALIAALAGMVERHKSTI
ncbi:MAG: DUF721 domain-containing protein [Glaciimonas sp.]|nr:DUF721 domain-containing protein [Glaciimonas sp.]